MKRTPLYSDHLALKCLISDYGDWELPSSYSTVEAECRAAREHCAVFDSSSAGKFIIKGKDAEQFMRRLITGSVGRCAPGSAQRSCICNDYGGIIDLVDLYRIADEEFLVTGNDQLIDRDMRWFMNARSGDTEINDISDEISSIDCIGPLSPPLLETIFSIKDIPADSFIHIMYDDRPAIVSHSEFCGINAYRIFVHGESVSSLWNKLLSGGSNYGITPIGIETKRTLCFERLEPVCGFEISESISPVEAGLLHLVTSDDNFHGRSEIESHIKNGCSRKIIVAEFTAAALPPAGSVIESDDGDAGIITRAAMNGKTVRAFIVADSRKLESGNTLFYRSNKTKSDLTIIKS